MKTFAGLDSKLENLPVWIKNCINFIAGITLEIYVVQYVLISILRNVAPFPINWICLTASIIISAYVLHIVSAKIIGLTERILKK